MSLVPWSEALDDVLKIWAPTTTVSNQVRGWTKLDTALSPLEPGHVIVVAGRPGMGTTAFATNFGLRWSGAVAFFALDLGSPAQVRRIVACETAISLSEMENGFAQRQDLEHAVEPLRGRYLYLDGTPGLSLDELGSKLEAFKATRPSEVPLLVVIDGFEQLRGEFGEEESEESLASKAAGLRSLAREHRLTMLVTAGVTDAVDRRGASERRPRPEDVKDGWALRRSADVLLLLYRDAYYYADGTRDEMEVRVGQHPGGRREEILMRYSPSSLRLEEAPPWDPFGDAG